MPPAVTVPSPAACEAQLNALCDKICPHSKQHGALLARLGPADATKVPAWRCYARSTLSADGMSFVGGTTYCTRHQRLIDELERCRLHSTSGATAAAVDATGGARRLSPEEAGARGAEPARPARTPPVPVPVQIPQPPVMPRPKPGGSSKPEPWIRVPRWRMAASHPPQYEHSEQYLTLPEGIRIPSVDDCSAELREGALFWAASLYTSSYAHKAARLQTSCDAWRVCCSTSLVPEGAFEGEPEGSLRLRHRMIASKPVFILRTLEASPLPVAWLDVDLEFHAFPTLFTPAGWQPDATWAPPDGLATRDVLLWNWQGNVSHFNGRRLKTASGVMWFNTTAPARQLLTAWAEAMAYEPNSAAPDDQALDLLVNDDGWIDRCAFGWLPAPYLRMAPRFSHIEPVLDHDRGLPVSGAGRNSNVKPVLPPHRPGT